MSASPQGEKLTRGFGFGDPPQCEAFLNDMGRYGWQLESVSEGPPWRRNSWFSLFRPVGAVTDGLSETGEPLRRWTYRVIGKRQDLIDRGEEQRIQNLVAAGWAIRKVLKAVPWNERPVTFLERLDEDVIEVVREDDAPQKRQMTLAKIRPEGGYDIELVDTDEPRKVGPIVPAEGDDED